ncbi:MAG: extracellular solute-binding protein [Reinekea sp.]
MYKKMICSVLTMALGASVVHAADDETLVIWGARDTDQLALVGQKFEEDFGIKLVIEKPSEPEKQYTVVAGSGGGPDIFFFAHDSIGEYVNGGLLSEIKPSKAIQNANISVAWEAVSFNGQYWGYPVSTEAIGLIPESVILQWMQSVRA